MNRCPSGLYFDDINKHCTFKNEARCGPIATSRFNFFLKKKTAQTKIKMHYNQQIEFISRNQHKLLDDQDHPNQMTFHGTMIEWDSLLVARLRLLILLGVFVFSQSSGMWT